MIFAVLLIVIAIVSVKGPGSKYKALGMLPESSVSDNILKSTKSHVFANIAKQLEYTTFLEGDGPFTVFVPTDIAYENLPKETKDYLNQVENQWAVRQIFLYHVVKGRYLTSDFKEGMKLETIQGEELTITRKDNYWEINGYSYLQTTDVVSANGVIHVTTNYILPPSLLE